MSNEISLINDDCIKAMNKLIEDNVKVDLILTDPPYGTTACKWDTVIPFKDMWECINQLTNNTTTILIFGTEPFSTYLRLSNINYYKYDLYWIKNRPTGFIHSKNKPLKNIELISVFSKGTTVHKNQSKNRMTYNPQGLVKINKKVKNHQNKLGNNIGKRKSNKEYTIQEYTNYPKMTINFEVIPSNKCIHPNQKPVELLEYLILTYSNPNDVVLDFTMGSGSTGIACQNTGRKFIGIEKEKKYYEIAIERIKNNNQTRLI